MLVLLMSMRPTRIVQGRGALSVVSTIVVSRMLMSRRQSSMDAPLSRARPFFRSVSSRSRCRSPRCPPMCICGIRSAELKRPSLMSMPSTPSCPWNILPKSMSTTTDPVCSRVSPSCTAVRSSSSMSRGKLMPTLFRVMSMPVASEAMPMAFCTAQFCMGGMYRSITSRTGMRSRAPRVMPVHFSMRRMIFKRMGALECVVCLIPLPLCSGPAKVCRPVRVP